jgi:hypothetical protein
MAVEFDEQSDISSPFLAEIEKDNARASILAHIFLDTGIAKTKQQADYLLLTIVIIFIAISILIAIFFVMPPKAQLVAPSGRHIIYPLNEPPRLNNV